MGSAAEAVHLASEPSRTTHGAREAIDACRYFASLLVGAVRGVATEKLLSPRFSAIAGLWDDEPLVDTIDAVAAGSFLRKDPPEIRGTGPVVRTLEATRWAFAETDDVRSGALRAVNLSDDADTTGAVFGQVAGAGYGEGALGANSSGRLARRDEIDALLDALADAADRRAT